LDDKEDFLADETPQALGRGPADPSDSVPAPEEAPPVADGDLTEPVTELDPSKPGLYVLRPRGLRPPVRAALRRSRSLRNDCPPDRRQASSRPSPKPRLR
jgi:hypothetical protein